MTPRNAGNARGLFGLALIAVGLLVMAVSGYYTVAALVAGLSFGAPWLLIAVLVTGGVPFAIGFVVFSIGRRLWANPGPRPGHEAPPAGSEP
jgi:hypothetical protein